MKHSVDLIVLSPVLLNPEWAFLRPLLHPGMLEKDSIPALVATNVDHTGPYLGLTIVLPDEQKGRKVHLPHGLVAVILEMVSHQNPLGFSDQWK